MDLTIDGITRWVTTGDRTSSRAEQQCIRQPFRTRVNVIDVFDAGDRYKKKRPG